MKEQTLRLPGNSVLKCGLLLGIILLAYAPSIALGQQLVAGDLVRVDSQIVGTVLSGRDGQLVLVRGRQDIRIPRPDTIRVLMDNVSIERWGGGGPHTKEGALIGAFAFGALGYVMGPKLGWGSAQRCTGLNFFGCTSYTAEEDAQRNGVFIFGLAGAGLGALIGRALPERWRQVNPGGCALRRAYRVGGNAESRRRTMKRTLTETSTKNRTPFPTSRPFAGRMNRPALRLMKADTPSSVSWAKAAWPWRGLWQHAGSPLTLREQYAGPLSSEAPQ